MAARVIVSSEGITTPADNSKPRYWEAKNHSENSYLRVENWLNDVNDLLLPGRHEIVKMTLEQGQAILRYIGNDSTNLKDTQNVIKSMGVIGRFMPSGDLGSIGRGTAAAGISKDLNQSPELQDSDKVPEEKNTLGQ